MTTVHLLRGLPASGKTTLARELVAAVDPGRAIRLNRDDLRRSLVDPDYRATVPAVEQRITLVERAAARDALRDGLDVVVDATNLRMRHAREWASLAQDHDADLVVHDVTTDVEECVRRDEVRGGIGGEYAVGEQVIRGMATRYLSGGWPGEVTPLNRSTSDVEAALAAAKPYVAVPGTRPAVVVDLDGTVALHDGIRSPYDTSRYHLDEPNTPVIDIVQRLVWAGESSLRVVFCSGRDETYRDVTERWLWDNIRLPSSWELFMRSAGDTRNDALVKLELFDAHIRDRYDVRAVIDDRDRIVAMYRSIGLTVLQCNYGAF